MKKISFLMLTTSLFYFTQMLTISDSDFTKSLIWFGIGGATTILKSTQLSKKLDGMSKELNADTDDLLSYFAVAALLKGSSYYLNRRHDNILYFVTSRLPLLTLISKLIATSRWYTKLIHYTPLLNSLLGCRNKHCEGICNKCKLKNNRSTFLLFTILGILDKNSFNICSNYLFY